MLSHRIIGSFLGALCGSCLGSPYVYMKSEDLISISPQIGWTLSPPSGDMSLCMGSMQSIGRNGVSLESVARAYCRVVSSSPEDIDLVSSVCFSSPLATPGAIRDCAASHQFGTLCSNGILVRQLPLIYAGLDWDDETLMQVVEEDTMLTHDDKHVVESTKAFARCLWSILRGKRRVETWDYLMSQTRDEKVHDCIVSSYFERPQCDRSDPTDIDLSLATALYHYWHDTPFVMALRSSILSGGATDVNAAVTGALCGASQGSHVVPSSWRSEIESPVDETCAWKKRARAALDTIEEYANRRETMGDQSLTRRACALRAKRFDDSHRLGVLKSSRANRSF